VRRLDQRGIDHGAALQQKAAAIELARELGEQLVAQSVSQQPVAETAKRRVIGRCRLQRQPQELAERYPVVDRLLEVCIRQSVPLLQKQRLQHQERREWRAARTFRPQMLEYLLQTIPLHLLGQTLQRGILADLRRYPSVPKSQLISHHPPPIRQN
jgi:hypothetical protein